MEPIEFAESNAILRKPDSMTDKECKDLYVFKNGKVIISCWKCSSLFERLKFLFTGTIWLWVMGVESQPPVSLQIQYPFIPEGETK